MWLEPASAHSRAAPFALICVPSRSFNTTDIINCCQHKKEIIVWRDSMLVDTTLVIILRYRSVSNPYVVYLKRICQLYLKKKNKTKNPAMTPFHLQDLRSPFPWVGLIIHLQSHFTRASGLQLSISWSWFSSLYFYHSLAFQFVFLTMLVHVDLLPELVFLGLPVSIWERASK